MRTTNPKLAAGLLEAGKREFLEKGFQGASLRKKEMGTYVIPKILNHPAE